MLLKDQRIIFVHIPKCAGSSVAYALMKKENYPNFRGYLKMSSADQKRYLTGLEYKHNTIASHKVKEFDKYYCFTIVRNPFDRFISSYFWKKEVETSLTLDKYLYQAEQYLKDHAHDETLKLHQKKIPHFLPQKNYVTIGNKNVMSDIFQFEQIGKVFEHLELSPQKRKIINSKKKASTLGDEELDRVRARIEELYQVDYEFFGFDRGPATKNVTIL